MRTAGTRNMIKPESTNKQSNVNSLSPNIKYQQKRWVSRQCRDSPSSYERSGRKKKQRISLCYMYDSYDGILMYTTVFFVLALSQPLGLPYADPSKTPCLQPSGLKVTKDLKIHGNSGSLRPNIHKNLKMSKHKTIKTNQHDIS